MMVLLLFCLHCTNLLYCPSPWSCHNLRQPVEKRFDSLIKPLRIIAHDRMASTCNGGELAVWNGGDHALGGIGGQNIALSTVDEQRRALQAPDSLPQSLGVTLAWTVRVTEHLIDFPGPRATRELAHAVAQALADVVQRTPGIEALHVSHGGIQGGPFLRSN